MVKMLGCNMIACMQWRSLGAGGKGHCTACTNTGFKNTSWLVVTLSQNQSVWYCGTNYFMAAYNMEVYNSLFFKFLFILLTTQDVKIRLNVVILLYKRRVFSKHLFASKMDASTSANHDDRPSFHLDHKCTICGKFGK
jgi:hypothetical protein